MKRLLDILAVVAAAPIWVPLFATVALAVLAIDGRPVFFLQERAGRKGRPFRMLKFRTMEPGTGKDRDRTTRLGSFLRAASLDELPQLLHVLSGKMSLVGPRPLPVAYLERYSPRQARRHEVRPGITGWAQIHGRNETSWEERLERDVWYAEHASLALDAKILFSTVALVLSGKGVNRSGETTMEEFGCSAKS